MAPAPIDILLATFNGAQWLPALLASLEAQTFQDWRLLVRDDGSTDGTLELLQEFHGRFASRTVLVTDPKPFPGAMGNFALLLSVSDAPYVMLCDQDDVWLPHKVARTLEVMTRSEAVNGPDTAILVFSDLKVVGADLRVEAGSYWKQQCLTPLRTTFHRLLVQNVVTGCTAMANRALLHRACPIPPDAFMHDWWLALVAEAFGQLVPIPEPLILYRQHEMNLLGAKSFSALSTLHHILQGKVRAYLRNAGTQAGAMLRLFDDTLLELRTPVAALAELDEQSWVKRKSLMVHHGFFFFGWLRNLGWLLVS